ncbi:MAG: carboxymuconolactone decarboxylase family protein [Anaerolineae bacterium]|nr:carboxymuconolactone decarboxylase family protein [Anaerolineae bacterium]MEB2288446.1 carboxymuconolactone decarboxylase family protein [Anaerolineae bacterium]
MSEEIRERLERFTAERQRQNARILAADHLGIRRFFNLDEAAYRGGALDAKTKEMLGLVASLVLRCDACVDYHLIQCVNLGATEAELVEVLNVGLIVGGSIVIPHLRHAFDTLDVLLAQGAG